MKLGGCNSEQLSVNSFNNKHLIFNVLYLKIGEKTSVVLSKLRLFFYLFHLAARLQETQINY